MNVNVEVTDNRRINIIFHFPVIRFKAVSITITQKDLITIYRQLNNEKLRNQIKQFIEDVDSWSEYETDIDGQEIKRVDLMSKGERVTIKHEEKLV